MGDGAEGRRGSGRTSAPEGVDGGRGVLLDEVGVDRDGRGRSLPRRGDDLGTGVDRVAGAPNARDGGAADDVGHGPAVVAGGAAEADKQVAVGDEAWPDEHRGAWYDLSGFKFDAGEPVVVDGKPGDGAVDDADATGKQLLARIS